LLVFFKLMDQLLKLLCLCLIAKDFILKLLELVLKCLNDAAVSTLFFLSSDDVFVEQVSLTHLLIDFLAVLVHDLFLGLIFLSR